MCRALVVLLCLLVLVVVQAEENVIGEKLDSKIIGGSNTNIANYPYLVSLQYDGSHYCGGVFIKAQYILTAAHCLENANLGSISVRVGTSTRNVGGTVYSAVEARYHESWNRATFNNDIGVVRVNTSIITGANVQLATLPAQDLETPAGTNFEIIGWGVSQIGGNQPSDTLQVATVQKVNNENCNTLDGLAEAVKGNMLCALGPTTDTCQGDSGGPLTVGQTVHGLVSWGIGCLFGNPGVYTRVSSYTNWIQSNTP